MTAVYDAPSVPVGACERQTREGLECLRPVSHRVVRDRYHKGRIHPSSQAWVGMNVCQHHADVIRRLDERYRLGLALVAVLQSRP